MSIRGNSGLGGFSGIIVSTNLKGDYKPNFSDTDVITNKDNTPFFAGKINSDDKSSSAQYIGGIAGRVVTMAKQEKVSIHAIDSAFVARAAQEA